MLLIILSEIIDANQKKYKPLNQELRLKKSFNFLLIFCSIFLLLIKPFTDLGQPQLSYLIYADRFEFILY